MEIFMKTNTINSMTARRDWRYFFGVLFMAVAFISSAAFAVQAPTLVAPADLATNQSTTLQLQWTAAAGDSVYHLEIDTASNFDSKIYNDSTLTGIENTVTGLKNATKYYWRVSVRDSAKNGGALSAYSTVRSFTTWNTTPTTPLLPVTLGLTGGFAILSYGGITNTGASVITGNVGVSPLAGSYMTGFGTPNVVGTIYGVDATGPAGSIPFPSMLTQAIVDLTTAYNDAAGRTVNPIGISGNIGVRTLYSGLYKSTGSLAISSGDLTLDAQGDVNAVWIFQIASGFNMTSGRQVFLSGGAKASNVFWQVGSAATFGTTTVMKGTIMAYTTITFATGASLEGRALARTASVTLQTNAIGGSAASPLSPEVFLGAAANFMVLAGSKISNTGLTTVTGDIGVSPSTVINGFPPGIFTGVEYPGDAPSAAAQLALKAAYDSTSALIADSTIATQLGGFTYTPAVYKSGSGTFGLTDTLTLNGNGDASAVWIFKMNGALTTASGSYVKLINGAKWYNVFWQVGTTATLGSNSTFSGSIMALSTITANNGANVVGRLLALTDSVSLNANNIDNPALANNIPSVPVLVSPINKGVSFRSDTLKFVWKSAAAATGYNFQLSTSSSFSSYVKNDSTADTTQKVTSLSHITNYYWRVRGYNSGGFSAFSSVDTLTTIVPISAVPLTISPSGATNVQRNATFKWHASTYAAKYHLQIASNNLVDSIGGFKAANVVFDTLTADTMKQLSHPLASSTMFYWHVNASDTAGTSDYSTVQNFTTGILVLVGEPNAGPAKFDLSQNYPNPFNPSTKINYSLQQAELVTLRVYNELGQEVATLVNGRQEAGSYSVTFNAGNGTRSLSSGVYFYRLNAGSFVSTKKLILMK